MLTSFILLKFCSMSLITQAIKSVNLFVLCSENSRCRLRSELSQIYLHVFGYICRMPRALKFLFNLINVISGSVYDERLFVVKQSFDCDDVECCRNGFEL